MDGYVTKPIDAVELARVIDQVVPPAAAPGTVPAAAIPVAPSVAGRPAFDERVFRARLGDDARLFEKMVRLFLEDCPARMRAMRRAIGAGDGEALREPAHALRGAAANFAAAPVVEAVQRLELQAKNGDLSQSLAAYDVLTREMQRLRRALAAPAFGRARPPAASGGEITNTSTASGSAVEQQVAYQRRAATHIASQRYRLLWKNCPAACRNIQPGAADGARTIGHSRFNVRRREHRIGNSDIAEGSGCARRNLRCRLSHSRTPARRFHLGGGFGRVAPTRSMERPLLHTPEVLVRDVLLLGPHTSGLIHQDQGDSTMAETSTFHDAFLDELRDTYDAEKQLTKALAKLAKAATSPQLREAFESHLEETQGQIQRLEQVFESLDEKVRGKHCDGIAGIIEEGKSIMEEDFDDATMDACLIAAGQRAEHYEMAAYGTLVAWARAMGHSEAADLLQENLDEEKAADEKLSALAEDGINEGAAETAHPDDEDEEPEPAAVGAGVTKMSAPKAKPGARR